GRRPTVVSSTRCPRGWKRAAPGCQRPSGATRPPPAIPARGTATRAPTSAVIAPGSTRASGLRKTMTSPVTCAAPRLAPVAKPRFEPGSTTGSHGAAAAAAAVLPSSEALSTTTTSHPARASSARLATQAPSASPAFQLTITTDDRTRPRLVSHAPRALPHARPAEKDVERIGRRHEEAGVPLAQAAAQHGGAQESPERLAAPAPQPHPSA